MSIRQLVAQERARHKLWRIRTACREPSQSPPRCWPAPWASSISPTASSCRPTTFASPRRRARLRPPTTSSSIAIDNESIRRMEPLVGRWPWPRLVHATVIDYLAAAGAKVIGYDVLFAERDIRKFMVADTEWTGEESDAALVESTKKAGNVVHIAEASSAELVDPSRALKENLDAPALNVRVPSVRLHRAAAARDAAVSGAGRGRRAASAIRCSTIDPERRGAARLASRAGRAIARSQSLSLATTMAAGSDAGAERAHRRDRPVRGHDSVARSGAEQQRPGHVHVVLVLRRLLFAAADPRGPEARHRSRALQGSHRHRRRHRPRG